MRHINQGLRDMVLADMVKTMDRHSLILIGDAEFGKTPMGRAIMMCMSRRALRKLGLPLEDAGFRSASEFDFFRGEPGRVACPDAFDDGDLHDQRIRVLKAFLDVGDYETMAWARWGASKWVRGQFRVVCDNTYARTALPDDPQPFMKLTNAAFLEAIRPALPAQCSSGNAMALLKRGHVLLNTKNAAKNPIVYYRPASADEVEVPYIFFSQAETYLEPSAWPLLLAKKEGRWTADATYEADIQWEAQWLANTLGEAAPRYSQPSQKVFKFAFAQRQGRQEIDLDDDANNRVFETLCLQQQVGGIDVDATQPEVSRLDQRRVDLDDPDATPIPPTYDE